MFIEEKQSKLDSARIKLALMEYFSLSDYGRLLKVIKKPYCIFGGAKSDILELLSLVEEKEQIKGFCVYGESFTKMNQGIKDRDYLIYNF